MESQFDLVSHHAAGTGRKLCHRLVRKSARCGFRRPDHLRVHGRPPYGSSRLLRPTVLERTRGGILPQGPHARRAPWELRPGLPAPDHPKRSKPRIEVRPWTRGFTSAMMTPNGSRYRSRLTIRRPWRSSVSMNRARSSPGGPASSPRPWIDLRQFIARVRQAGKSMVHGRGRVSGREVPRNRSPGRPNLPV